MCYNNTELFSIALDERWLILSQDTFFDAQNLSDEEFEEQRQARRENAKRLLRESGLTAMLQALNKDTLKSRGRFEEYDSILLLRWGTGYTGRHIWIEMVDDTIRFRLNQHRRCQPAVPLCDGEYHTFTREMWSNPTLLQNELTKYYLKPVAESSND